MSTEFVEPQPVKSELIEELDGLVDQLRDLSIRKPVQFHVQESMMQARMSDFLELAEQDFIKGWTDYNEGIQHKSGLSQAYNAGYADCYEYENRGDQS